MENLTFNSKKLLDTTNFVRVGDLSNFEGPLLSLFEDLNSGYFYLFDWVDRDQNANRWLIYRVSPKYLLEFLNSKISHLELFEKRPDKTIFFTDIDSKNKSFSQYDSFELVNLSSNYYPNSDNFFDIADCNPFEKIKSVVINSLSRKKSENEYSIVYKIRVLKHKEVKSIYFNRVQNITKSISLPSRYYEHTNIKIESSSLVFNIPNKEFKSYSTLKKQESINRKEYANQYN